MKKKVKVHAIGVSEDFERKIQEAYDLYAGIGGGMTLTAFLRALLVQGANGFLETRDIFYAYRKNYTAFPSKDINAVFERTPITRQKTGAKIIQFRGR